MFSLRSKVAVEPIFMAVKFLGKSTFSSGKEATMMARDSSTILRISE